MIDRQDYLSMGVPGAMCPAKVNERKWASPRRALAGPYSAAVCVVFGAAGCAGKGPLVWHGMDAAERPSVDVWRMSFEDRKDSASRIHYMALIHQFTKVAFHFCSRRLVPTL